MNAPAAADPLPALLHLESRARHAATRAELQFVVVNETFQMVPYRQAVLVCPDALGRARIAALSGLATLEEDAPFSQWLTAVAGHLWSTLGTGPVALSARDLPAPLAADWNEWLPAHGLVTPLRAPDGTAIGFVLYLRDEAWSAQPIGLLSALHDAYGHALWALAPRAGRASRIAGGARRHPLWLALVLLAAAGALLIPIRQSVLAPAEVIALDAEVVAAPMDGVIRRFHAAPNAIVKAGDLLFTFDDTTLRNRREVTAKGLDVARADALTAAQKAFDSQQSKSELAGVQGRVREREADLEYLDELLARIDVRAARGGVFVYGDPNDWLGRPVATGERIGQLADPAQAGVLVWLAAADAINLEVGAPMRVFLHVAPLAPIEAVLVQTSYQATPSPDGVAAYRIRGTIAGSPPEARIGLKGTAKLYGERAPLGYLLLRRPIASVREWTGL